MTDGKVLAFRALKPPCVALNGAALQFKTRKSGGKDVTIATERLLHDLESLKNRDNVVDSNIAEYVFVPLSHVFSEAKALPTRAVETGLWCLTFLLRSTWRNSITKEVVRQLMVMLGVLAGENPQEPNTKNVKEELSAAAFECLLCLFELPGAGISLTKTRVDPESIPHLSFAVTVLLDGAAEAPSTNIRLTALKTISAAFENLGDQGELRKLFPGVVSTLTRLLSSSKGTSGSYRIIEACLQALEQVLIKTVSDGREANEVDLETHADQGQHEPDPWTKASAGQVKQRLAGILPLRYHQRAEVRNSMTDLCFALVYKCQRSLKDSLPMLLDSLVILASQEDADRDPARLQQLLHRLPSMYDILKSSLRDWTISLPRILQSNDDNRQQQYLSQISTAIKLLTSQEGALTVLNESLATTLQSSVQALLSQNTTSGVRALSDTATDVNQMLQLADPITRSIIFQPILSTKPSQRQAVQGLQALVREFQGQSFRSSLETEIISSLRLTSGTEQVASLWLAVQMLTNGPNETDPSISQYLNFSEENALDSIDPFLEETYAFALDVLSKPEYEEAFDWRLQALSIEVLALQASHQKTDFRPELVDALFPILERIGSTNSALQNHALTCLNIVSSACEYSSPKDLIIDNVDYLVNAISLKLNTFDISPQSPRILVMMVKLCGESLIPYLDDLVESIFTILACFHGYPRLVESLFQVLNAIVEEGNRGMEKAIMDGTEKADGRPKPLPTHPITTSLDDLVAEIKAITAKTNSSSYDPILALDLDDPPPSKSNDHPDTPPNPTASSSSPSSPPSEDEEEPLSTNNSSSSNPPPPSKTTHLLTRITSLTQHHLPTSSPSLRLLLLHLLPHAFSALSPQPDTFLPLVNAIWPVLITRLQDPETYIVTAAAEALKSLNETAGDFLRGRWEDEWKSFVGIYKKAEKGMEVEKRGYRRPRGRGSMSTQPILTKSDDSSVSLPRGIAPPSIQSPPPSAPATAISVSTTTSTTRGERHRTHLSLLHLLLSLITYVGLPTTPSSSEDTAFELLSPYIGKVPDVRECLEGLNRDALWFVEEQRMVLMEEEEEGGKTEEGDKGKGKKTRVQQEMGGRRSSSSSRKEYWEGEWERVMERSKAEGGSGLEFGRPDFG